MTDVVNLDAHCAGCGYEIVNKVAPTCTLSKADKSKLENTITKSLGVLQEQGVYAFFLFLKYVEDEKGAKEIRNSTTDLLRQAAIHILRKKKEGEQEDFPALHDLTTNMDNLDNLLLARQLLEQTLIYARYHAKALTPNDQSTTGEQ